MNVELVHPSTLIAGDKILLNNNLKCTITSNGKKGDGVESRINPFEYYLRGVIDNIGSLYLLDYPSPNCFGSKVLEDQFKNNTKIKKVIL